MSEKLNQFIEKLVETFKGQRTEFAGEPSVILPVEKIQSGETDP